jgi:ribosomal RNA-processing protein 9
MAIGKKKPAAAQKQQRGAAGALSRTAAAAADVLRELEAEQAPADPRHAGLNGNGGGDDGEHLDGPKNAEAEAAAVLRSLGEHVDTRRGGEVMEVDEEGIGRGAFGDLDVDEDDDGGQVDTTFRPLAAAIPADSVELVAAQVATGQLESGNLFLGHNRNTVTCVTCRDDAIVYGDKLGVVTKVTLPGRTGFSATKRELCLPHVDSPVLCLAISDTAALRHQGMNRTTADTSVTSFIAAGTAKGVIRIWNASTLEHVGDLTLHRGPVTGLAFRLNTSVLVSVSQDKVVRAWSVNSMSSLDRYFGHQSGINAVSVLRAERAVTVGEDRTPFLWKLDRATQTGYAQLHSPCDAVTMLDENTFLVGCRNGALLLFDVMKRSPVWHKDFAHGYGWGGDGTGIEREGRTKLERFGVAEAPANPSDSFGNAITSIAAVPFSDLIATGSCDGYVRIWRYVSPEIDPSAEGKRLDLVGQAPVFGFVNGLAFNYDGREIVCAVGKEPRQGRWLVQRSARNGVQRIPLSATGAGARRSIVKETTVPAPTPEADQAAIQRLLAQARKPTERQQAMDERKSKAAAAVASAGAKAARNSAQAARKAPSVKAALVEDNDDDDSANAVSAAPAPRASARASTGGAESSPAARRSARASAGAGAGASAKTPPSVAKEARASARVAASPATTGKKKGPRKSA